MESLPDEVFIKICRVLKDTRHSEGDELILDSLASLCLVSRRWSHAARPFLYEDPPLLLNKNEQSPLFSMAQNPELALYLRKIVITDDILTPHLRINPALQSIDLEPCLSNSIRRAYNLTDVEVECYSDSAISFCKVLFSVPFAGLLSLKIAGNLEDLLEHVTLPRVKELCLVSAGRSIVGFAARILVDQLQSYATNDGQQSQGKRYRRTPPRLENLLLSDASGVVVRSAYGSDLRTSIPMFQHFINLTTLSLSELANVSDSSLLPLIKAVSPHLQYLNLRRVGFSCEFFKSAAPFLTNLRGLHCSPMPWVQFQMQLFSSVFQYFLPSAQQLEYLKIFFNPLLGNGRTLFIPDYIFSKIVPPVASNLSILSLSYVCISLKSLCRFSHAPLKKLEISIDSAIHVNAKNDLDTLFGSFQHMKELVIHSDIQTSIKNDPNRPLMI